MSVRQQDRLRWLLALVGLAGVVAGALVREALEFPENRLRRDGVL